MPKENWSKKNYRSEFLQSSFRFVIYLFKEVYRKIMSEIYFVGKTQYEDLTEWLLSDCYLFRDLRRIEEQSRMRITNL